MINISNDDVQEMRYQYWCKVKPISEIALKYGLKISTARNILHYESRAKIPDKFDYSDIKRSA